jgi:hypothetical protein
VVRTEAGSLHLPAAYATHLTSEIVSAAGLCPETQVTITAQDSGGNESDIEFFVAGRPMQFDPSFRVYVLEGVAGRLPSTRRLDVSGAFHVPAGWQKVDEAMRSRTHHDFTNQVHGRIFDWLSNGIEPTEFNGSTVRTSAFLARLRDFKKNAKRRFKIIDKHLVYLVHKRQRKDVVRNIRIHLYPHRIVPFKDEVDKVRVRACTRGISH